MRMWTRTGNVSRVRGLRLQLMCLLLRPRMTESNSDAQDSLLPGRASVSCSSGRPRTHARTHARTRARTHARTHARVHTHAGTHASTHTRARRHTHTSLNSVHVHADHGVFRAMRLAGAIRLFRKLSLRVLAVAEVCASAADRCFCHTLRLLRVHGSMDLRA